MGGIRIDTRRVASACAALVAAAALVAPAPARAAQAEASFAVSRYGDLLAGENGRLSVPERRELAERVLLLSSYYRLDPRLLIALVTVESAWRSRAVSPVGARGLGQLMPGTAAALKVDSFETYENLDGTARYLRRLLMRFPNYAQPMQYRFALAAYNAGPGAVDRYHGVPPYAETQSYVARVMGVWERYRDSAAAPSPHAFAARHVALSRPRRPHHALQVVNVPIRGLRPAMVLARIPHYAPQRLGAPQLDLGQAPRRRGLLAFLHRRHEPAGPESQATPAPGEDAIAEQRGFIARNGRF
ncbi:MAG: lytic transglycosylase domain-containing protein [Candidatus Velthaea sp.]